MSCHGDAYWAVQAALHVPSGDQSAITTPRARPGQPQRPMCLGPSPIHSPTIRRRTPGWRWTERMFDAGQGEAFHDPGKAFSERWRHWTGYPPPDVHRALLARSLFRVWNAGPEYNLARALRRGDGLAFAQCRQRFVDEVLELAFCWNERYVPAFKWRAAHFRRLPTVPVTVREGLETIHAAADAPEQLAAAGRVVQSIKRLIGDLYHLASPPDEPLSSLAHAVRAMIADEAVRNHASLDW